MSNMKPQAGNKSRMSLLPFRALEAVASAFHHGAIKYEPWNWMEGHDPTRYADALLRHVHAFADPTLPDYDEESGLHHLAHAGACVLILLTYLHVGWQQPKNAKETDVPKPVLPKIPRLHDPYGIE